MFFLKCLIELVLYTTDMFYRTVFIEILKIFLSLLVLLFYTICHFMMHLNYYYYYFYYYYYLITTCMCQSRVVSTVCVTLITQCPTSNSTELLPY